MVYKLTDLEAKKKSDLIGIVGELQSKENEVRTEKVLLQENRLQALVIVWVLIIVLVLGVGFFYHVDVTRIFEIMYLGR